jgi:hypothetical protein
MHLTGKKCKDDPDEKRRLTLDEYRAKYGDHNTNQVDEIPDRPLRKVTKPNLLKQLSKITPEEIDAEVERIDAELKDLQKQKKLLESIGAFLSDADFTDEDDDDEDPVDNDLEDEDDLEDPEEDEEDPRTRNQRIAAAIMNHMAGRNRDASVTIKDISTALDEEIQTVQRVVDVLVQSQRLEKVGQFVKLP